MDNGNALPSEPDLLWRDVVIERVYGTRDLLDIAATVRDDIEREAKVEE